MRLKIFAAIIVLIVVAAWSAWRLIPVQILVIANRLVHPVAPNRQVHWAQGPQVAPARERPPNIVLILADDLGINDITAEGLGTGVAGGLVPTPNIDAIAHQGADFTTGYAANATCSPSRAALMTGRYPQRFGFEFTAVPPQLAKYVPRYSDQNRPYRTIYHAELQRLVPPMADMGVPGSEVTIAELLKERGYHTIHLGKWHLGEAKGMRPEDQGFDESLGFMPGASKYTEGTLGRCATSRRSSRPFAVGRADRRRSVQWKQAVSRRQVHDRLSERSGSSGHQGQSEPALLHLSGLQCSAHAVSGDEGGLSRAVRDQGPPDAHLRSDGPSARSRRGRGHGGAERRRASITTPSSFSRATMAVPGMQAFPTSTNPIAGGRGPSSKEASANPTSSAGLPRSRPECG